MELQHLRTFLAVAAAQSLTRAGEQLQLSQPAVSAQIKALEEQLGLALFRRTGRGVQLTAAGSELLPHAQGVMGRVAALGRRAQELAGAAPSALTLAVMDCGFDLKLARIVGQVRQRQPELGVRLTTGTSADNLRAVLDETVDVAFLEGEWDSPRVRFWQLGSSRVGIIAPCAWRERLDAGWQQLARVPWVLQGEGCSYRRLVIELCQQHGICIEPEYRAEAFGAVRDLVREGLAVSVADLDEAQPWIEAGEVFAWQGFERRLPVWLVALDERSTEPAVSGFVETALRAHSRTSAARV